MNKTTVYSPPALVQKALYLQTTSFTLLWHPTGKETICLFIILLFFSLWKHYCWTLAKPSSDGHYELTKALGEQERWLTFMGNTWGPKETYGQMPCGHVQAVAAGLKAKLCSLFLFKHENRHSQWCSWKWSHGKLLITLGHSGGGR